MLPIDKQYLIRNIRSFKSVILDPAYIIQYATLPVASEDYEGIIYQYTGSASGMTLGGFYQCQEITPSTSPKTYHWVEITTKTAIDGVTIRENANDEIYVVNATSLAKGIIKLGEGLDTDTNGATNVVDRVIVASTMPTAAAALDGNVYLYCGTTTTTAPIYQKGYLYKCQESSTTGVYEFVQIGLHADEDTIHAAADGELSVDEDYKKIYVGTTDDWDLLTTAEKIVYDEAHFTNDEPSVDNDLYQTKDLATPITIGGTSQTTVEGALGGLNSAKLDEKRGRYIVDTRAELDTVLEAIYTSLSNNTQIITQIADKTGVIWGGGSHCVIVSKVDSNWGTALFFGYNRNGESFIIPRISGDWGNIVTNIRDSDVTSTVTSGSTAPITSGGMYDAMYANQQYGKMNIYALGKTNIVQNANYIYTIPKYCSFLITTASGAVNDELSVMAGILYGASSFTINAIVGTHSQATLKIEGGIDSNNKGYIKFTNTSTSTRSVNVIIISNWSD